MDKDLAQHLKNAEHYKQQGNFSACVDAMNQALLLAAEDISLWLQLGELYLYKLKEWGQAESCFQRVLLLDEHNLQARMMLNSLYAERGDLAKMQQGFAELLQLYPQDNTIMAAYAFLLQRLNAEALAEQYADQVLAANPQELLALIAKANILIAQQQFQQAQKYATAAFQQQPNMIANRLLQARLLRYDHHYQQAIEHLHAVLAKDAHNYDAVNELSMCYMGLREYDKAIAMSEFAINLPGDNDIFKFRLGLIYLLLGQFQPGWQYYEYRLSGVEAKIIPDILQQAPLWQQSTAAGQRVLVCKEQGFGDFIQFSRYIPKLQALLKGSKVVVYIDKALLPLYRDLWPGVEWITELENARLTSYIPIMSLPQRLALPDPIPAAVQFTLDPQAKGYLPLQRKKLLNVGLVWSGNQENPRDKIRSIPFSYYEQLNVGEQVLYHSLQYNGEAHNCPIQAEKIDIIDYRQQINSFYNTASLISQLDLVISVDTAVAHLAASLRVPTWLLLPTNPDWRWQLEREDSPWYEHIRLFRQQTPGDWQTVITQVRAQLKQRLSS